MSFFKKIFKEEFSIRPTLDNLYFNHISQELANLLTSPFTNDEIDEAMALVT